MKAEEVYNIAINLPIKELEKLYNMLEKNLIKKQNSKRKTRIKKKIITDDEARNYILKTVFKINL